MKYISFAIYSGMQYALIYFGINNYPGLINLFSLWVWIVTLIYVICWWGLLSVKDAGIQSEKLIDELNGQSKLYRFLTYTHGFAVLGISAFYGWEFTTIGLSVMIVAFYLLTQFANARKNREIGV